MEYKWIVPKLFGDVISNGRIVALVYTPYFGCFDPNPGPVNCGKFASTFVFKSAVWEILEACYGLACARRV